MGLLLPTVSQSCKIKNKNCSCVVELKIKAKLKNGCELSVSCLSCSQFLQASCTFNAPHDLSICTVKTKNYFPRRMSAENSMASLQEWPHRNIVPGLYFLELQLDLFGLTYWAVSVRKWTDLMWWIWDYCQFYQRSVCFKFKWAMMTQPGLSNSTVYLVRKL